MTGKDLIRTIKENNLEDKTNAAKNTTVGDVFDTFTEDQRIAIEFIIGSIVVKKDWGIPLGYMTLHDSKEKLTISKIYSTLTTEQRMVAEFIIGLSLSSDIDSEELKDDDTKKSIFHKGQTYLIEECVCLRTI